jgi:predicted TPR repeat methyltransferase
VGQGSNADRRYEQAAALHRGGHPGEAETLYREVLADEPSHFGALHLLGVIAGQGCRYAEARGLIEQAIRVDSRVAAAHVNLGHAHYALGFLGEALASYERALVLQPAYRLALMGRGKTCWALGRLTDALASYDAALDIEPDCGESQMHRGDILLGLGRSADAVVSLRRAMACGADAERIRFVLASIGEAAIPVVAPAGYVQDLFDHYAAGFDQALVEGLHYRTPESLARLVSIHSSPAPLDILDLGCGTGLCGPLLKPLARRLTGIDLSATMLARARARAVYSELECVELTDYLSRHEREFDLVVAADVFVYVGDLAPAFAGAQRALRAGGRFAFSVEASEQRDWELAVTRRYRHAKPYLERLAGEHGFAVAAVENSVLRHNDGNDVHGYLALLTCC